MDLLPTLSLVKKKLRSFLKLPLIQQSKMSWWLEVKTTVPLCTYYFGPFENRQEAQDSRAGYIEDLQQEDARDIIALVKRCHEPEVLTIDCGYYSSSI